MFIRMKEKYFSAKRFKHQYNNPNTEVVPGCQLYKERLRLKHAYASNDVIEIRRAFTAYEKSFMEATKSKHARPCLSMVLRHGDIVVMHGREIQKYFEVSLFQFVSVEPDFNLSQHEVVPKGKLRFALTSRYIIPDMVDKSEHWKGEFELDPSEVYDGDVSLTLDAKSPSSLQAEPVEVDMVMSQTTIDDLSSESDMDGSQFVIDDVVIDDGSTDREFLDQWEMMNGSDGL